MKDLLKSVPMSPQEEITPLLYVVKGEVAENISKAMKLASLFETYRLNNLSTEVREKIIVLLQEFEKNISNVLDSELGYSVDKSQKVEEAKEAQPEEKGEVEPRRCPECDTEVSDDATTCPECEYDFTSEKEEDA